MPTQAKITSGTEVETKTISIKVEPSPVRERHPFLFNIAAVLICFFIAVGITQFIEMFVVQPFAIPSESMETTIMVSDRVFVEKISYKTTSPEYGDIVVLDNPEDASGTKLIKRVIATEGQTIAIHDGCVYVDRERINEDYVQGETTLPDISEYDEESAAIAKEEVFALYDGIDLESGYTLQEGELWVMGDNRENSVDSRYFGPISIDSIVGKAFYIYWPIDRAGSLY